MITILLPPLVLNLTWLSFTFVSIALYLYKTINNFLIFEENGLLLKKITDNKLIQNIYINIISLQTLFIHNINGIIIIDIK